MNLITRLNLAIDLFLARKLGFKIRFKVLVASPGSNPYFAIMQGIPDPKAGMLILIDEKNSTKIIVFDHMIDGGDVFQFDSEKGRSTVRIIE